MRPAEPEFIIIGEILAPWSLRGAVKVAVTTDFPQRFSPSATVYVNRQPVTIDRVEWQGRQAIINFSAVDSIEEAEKLRGQVIEIHHSQLYRLPEEQYYCFQLIGLAVWTTRGELVGNITEILTASSNDIYVVNGTEGEVLIPAIEDVVRSVDLDEGRLVIEPIEGLLGLNKKRTR